ncbi:hypothetical protein AAFN90_01835 [Erwiniaceae bacterium CAU 1747]
MTRLIQRLSRIILVREKINYVTLLGNSDRHLKKPNSAKRKVLQGILEGVRNHFDSYPSAARVEILF